MADIKPIVTADEFSALDADEQALYKKRGESEYILDVAGIKNALEHEKTNFKTYKESTEPLKQFEGLSFEEVQAALDIKRKLDDKKLIDKDGYEAALKQKQDAYDKALKAATDEAESKYNALFNSLKTEKAINFLTSKGVLPDRADLALIKLGDQIDLEIRDGKQILKRKDGIGDAKELDELAEGLKSSAAFLFAPNGASGSGASGSNSLGAGLDLDSMTPEQKIAFANSQTT